MSTTTIAGKPSNTIGEKDSTLVLRGSSIKIQWVNKFIDLIKNGKINSDSQKLLKTADSTEELTTDGLYLVGDSVWAVIGGTKVQLSGDSTTTYVSYLTEQKDVTGEQKERALTNIGFYYNTLEEAQNSGLTSGIIYVQGDNPSRRVCREQVHPTCPQRGEVSWQRCVEQQGYPYPNKRLPYPSWKTIFLRSLGIAFQY